MNKVNKSGVPALRFFEFKNAPVWEEKKLEDICDVNPTINKLPHSFIYVDLESVVTGKLLQENEIQKESAPSRAQRLLSKGDVIYQTVRPYQKNNLFFNLNNGKDYVASTGYAQLRAFESNSFLYQLIHIDTFVNKVLEQSTGSNYPAINSKDLAKINIFIPKPKEQQKIADFLTSLDDLITAQSQKVDSLKQHKKGLMQQLFPQADTNLPKLRFPAFKNAPVWEEKKLGDIFVGKKGRGLSKKDIIKGGKNKCILYGELYTKYSEAIDKIISHTNLDNGIKSEEGDLLIPCSTTTTAIDLANVTALKKKNVLIGGDVSILRFKKNGDSIFFSYYMNFCKKFELSKYGQGSTIVHLYYNHFKNMNLFHPKPKEQQKIADCLTSLDDLITAQNQKIETLKQHKKGLMQKLFPEN